MIEHRNQEEPAPQDKAPSEDSPWNSLEIAKIFVGVLTPLSLAALGYIVSTTSTKEERAYQQGLRKEANDREREARLEAQAQAERLARRTEEKEAAREKAARENADRARRLASYEAALDRAAALQRELAIQDRAEAREARLRAEAQEQARQAVIYERRTVLWNETAQALQNLREAADQIEAARRNGAPPPPQEVERYRNVISSLEGRIEPYLSFFSEEFGFAFHMFMRAARDGLGAGDFQIVRQAHDDLVEAARTNLTPPPPGNP